MFKVSKAGVIRPRGSWVTALEASEKPRRPRRRSTTAKLSSTKPAAVLGAGGAKKNLRKTDIATGQQEKSRHPTSLPFYFLTLYFCLSSFLSNPCKRCRRYLHRRQRCEHRLRLYRRRARLCPRPYRRPSPFVR